MHLDGVTAGLERRDQVTARRDIDNARSAPTRCGDCLTESGAVVMYTIAGSSELAHIDHRFCSIIETL